MSIQLTGLPSTLQTLITQYQDRIAQVDDERATGDGYWVYLAAGFADEDGGTILHEYTVKDLRRRLQHSRRAAETSRDELYQLQKGAR
ncbi:MAG: hypothetical protein KKA73_06515 [Chloroflexi bacterium]|nr:hypothetical protein [Chloroflexota bacterium]MBU1747324.1 hypothetical protein [Chloroflexota bacterium]